MLIGFSRSLVITILAFAFGGLNGMAAFLLCAFIAKLFLEAINYIEHYGLVREEENRLRCDIHGTRITFSVVSTCAM